MTLKRVLTTILLLLVFVLFIFLAYLWIDHTFPYLSGKSTQDPVSTLKTNLQKWRAQNIDHYQFTLHIGCLCSDPGPFIIEVNNGRAVSIIDEKGALITFNDDPNAGPSDIDLYAHFTTMDRMFSFAQEVISQGGDFNGEYDSSRGFPTMMCFYNCGHMTPMVVDGNVGFNVSDFEQLP